MSGAKFKGITDIQNMSNNLKNSFDGLLRLNSNGISQYTMEQIRAKAAVLGLTDSLTIQAVAMAKDADFSAKAATGTLTFGKALDKGIGSTDELANALKESGKLTGENIDKISKAAIIGGDAYRTTVSSIISENDEIKNSTIKIGASASQSTGFINSFKQSFKGLYATLKPMLPLIATIGTAFAAYKGFKFLDDKFTLTFGAAQKHLEDSSSAYAATVSELENLNSQTDQYKSTLESIGNNYDIKFSGSETVDGMIEKLRLIDGKKINLTDESIISKLERENDLLETRKNLLTTTADSQQRKSAEDARKSINFASEEISLKKANGEAASHRNDGSDVKYKVDRKRYVQELVGEMERAQKQIDEAQDKLNDKSTSKADKKTYKKQFEQATENLEKYKNEATEIATKLDEEAKRFYDEQTGLVISGFEDDAKAVKEVTDLVTNFDLSPAEKDLKSLDTFFSSTAGNAIGDYLNNIVAESGNAEDALRKFKELGLSLDDIGVSQDNFIKYFQDVAKSAEQAKEKTSSLGTTLSDVDKAFESENKDANWKKFADYATQARDLAKQGKWGTDDLQKSIEWVLPKFDVKKELKKNDDLEYVADVYEKKYKDAEKLYKKFFDPENPKKSVSNFQNALIDKGLLKEDETGLTGTFDNTAEAAEKMKISIEATEALLRNLESYGFEWDDVMFSGEGIARYENALNSIKSIRDSMGEGAGKDRLNNLIEGWDSEYSKYQKDLSELSEDKIVHIEFEYDLAQLDAEIAELEKNVANSDGKDIKENAALLAKKQTRRDTAEKYLTEERGMKLPVEYEFADNAISELQSKLKQSGLNKDQKVELQAEITNLTDLQNNLLNAFDSSNMSWNDFIKTDTFDKFISDINDAKSKVEDLNGESIDMKSDIDTSKIDSKIDGVLSNDGKTITMKVNASSDQIQAQLNQLQNGQKMVFNANVDGKQTNVSAAKDEKGKITYTAVIDNVEKILTQKGTVDYTIGSQEEPKDKNSNVNYTKGEQENPEDKNTKVNYDKGKQEKPDKQKTTVDYNKGKQQNPDPKNTGVNYKKTGQEAPSDKTANVYYKVAGSAAGSAISKAIKGAKGKGKLSGTAYKDGTIENKNSTATLPFSKKGVSKKTDGLYPIPKLSGRALAYGTLEDDYWLRDKWRTKKSEVALTGEEGQELVATRDNRWFTVGDKGAEFAHIPAGSVVFNAKQTEELLKNGSINSRGKAYLSGTAYASGNGGRKISGSSSSKKKTTKSSSKSKSNSKKSSKKAAKDAKKAKETFDWIEVAIDRIERAIDSLDLKASSVYRSWSSRNANLKSEISNVSAEITKQQQGYKRYIKEANKVGLSSGWKKKVQNGTIDISTVKDEKLAEKIKEYQQW